MFFRSSINSIILAYIMGKVKDFSRIFEGKGERK